MTPTKFLDGKVELWCGDCLEVLDRLPANSIDSCVVDPPYHLSSIVKRFGQEDSAPAQHGKDSAYARQSRGFMSKVWDGGDVAFRSETWAKVLRVLKPGAYIVAFSSSRGFGRMSIAIEDAGFVTHPLLADLLSKDPLVSQFMQSLSDEQAGAFARLIDESDYGGILGWCFGSGFPKATRIKADGYDGFRYGGQALKPAIEPIYMGQKPFSEANGTANILLHGTGALNIDACRIVGESTTRKRTDNDFGIVNDDGWAPTPGTNGSHLGRWPANLIHDGSDEVVAAFPDSKSGTGAVKRATGSDTGGNTSNAFGAESRPAGTAMICHGDEGSAARFFYSAKQDHICSLCSAHIAADSSRIPITQSESSALFGAVAMQRRGSEAIATRPPSNASDAALRSSLCHPTNDGSVLHLAETLPLEKIVQNVLSAADLCHSCATDIARALAEVRQSGPRVLSPSIFSIGGFSAIILHRCLASYVAGRESTDIILTTTNLKELFGCVFHAIAENTNSAKAGNEASTELEKKRLWYSSKADSEDRLGSKHPTVKPLDLIQYLCRLVTPPGGIVLDCFAGTGTTGEAAWREGFRAILIEREAEYQADIARRMDLVLKPTKRAAVAKSKNNLQGAEGTPLFGGLSEIAGGGTAGRSTATSPIRTDDWPDRSQAMNEAAE